MPEPRIRIITTADVDRVIDALTPFTNAAITEIDDDRYVGEDPTEAALFLANLHRVMAGCVLRVGNPA